MTAPKFTPSPWVSVRYGYEKHAIHGQRGTEVGFVHRYYDANLIAAAPDLYGALSLMISNFIGLCNAQDRETVLAAHAKARGEQ